MSTIKVNTITKRTGSTLTLGESGTTVTLACGATQTGFGRTGTVDWCTTAKTSPFTSESSKGYFVNTASGAVTVTLPASPSAGDIVALKDYSNSWDTNNVTLCRNGSKICGIAQNTNLNTESQSVTLIYVDGTKGWQDIHDSTANIQGNPGFISATGGTVTTCGDFKIHTFTSDGCFAVTNTFGSGVGAKVSYVVVAGGAGGAGNGGNNDGGAGGGAGGFREGKQACAGYTASPLAATPCSGLPVSVQTYSITVGAGGTAGAGSPSGSGGTGGNSVFSTITSAGGGGGARSPTTGGSGGSGGGGVNAACTGGAGNTPPVSPPQGNNGSPGVNSGSSAGGGGGGATAVAGSATLSPLKGGAGGAGATSSITGSPVTRAGGGGGAGYTAGSNPAPNSGGDGGSGGGGSGGSNPGFPHTPFDGQAGTVNTGGGGGAAANDGGAGPGGAGGSGVVIIRYKFQ